MGLLEHDNHWNMTLEEATASQSPSSMRNLFAIMITACEISDPLRLWETHKEALSEDIKNRIRKENRLEEIRYTEEMFNESLIRLEDMVVSMSGKTLDRWGLPSPDRTGTSPISRDWIRETNYDIPSLEKYVTEYEPLLEQDQKVAYEIITECVENGAGGIIFLDAPGKTFVLNLLLAKMRSQKKIALAVASSGIASTLLQGGRTAHSAFKLPLDMNIVEYPVCGIGKRSDAARVLENCHLVVWDEATMSPKQAVEALDRTMRDLRARNSPIGGATLVLSGDFRQILPIVLCGTPADEINSSIKSSYLRREVKILHLRTTMRVKLNGDQNSAKFADMVLRIGNEQIPDSDGLITIPRDCGKIIPSAEELKVCVYPNLAEIFNNVSWLCERAILALLNDTVNDINYQLLQELPGDERLYSSIDNTLDTEQATQYPTEFLNSLDISGMPSHRLILKVGCPIMLRRNLDAPVV